MHTRGTDAIPLATRPSLEQYRKQAKDLVTAAKLGDPGAVRAWATDWLQTLAGLLGVTITPFVQGSFDRAIEHIEGRVREKVSATHASGATFTLAEIGRAHV